jgi:hypothetical protein
VGARAAVGGYRSVSEMAAKPMPAGPGAGRGAPSQRSDPVMAPRCRGVGGGGEGREISRRGAPLCGRSDGRRAGLAVVGYDCVAP